MTKRPRGLPTWTLAALAAVGVVAAVSSLGAELYQFGRLHVVRNRPEPADRAWACLAAIAVSVAVPVCAVLVRPRRLALALFAGWVAGESAIGIGAYVWAGGVGSSVLLSPSSAARSPRSRLRESLCPGEPRRYA